MIAESDKFKFDREAVLKALPLCGSCMNIKLLAWEEGTDLKSGIGKMATRPLGMKTPLVAVNCGWLKVQIPEPHKLRVCDGWMDRDAAPKNRQRE